MSIFKEKYRIENRIFETTMSIYTIKQDSEGGLFLLNEEGKRVSTLDILQTTEPHRVYAFYGKMGAGKTTFVKAICEELGVEDVITSPTFALVNEYTAGNGDPIYHFDFYRIKKIDEVYDMGYEDYFYSGNLCFLEWPELIEDLLPEDCTKVTITVEEDGSRSVEF